MRTLALALLAVAMTAPSLVTPVTGPSNFHRRGIPFDSSAMGRTGVWGPPPEAYTPPPTVFMYNAASPRTTVLTGADIYRLSCQGCHRAHGEGTPPEIPTVVGPVQSSNATFMENLMKERGRPVPPSFARELAAGSKTDLLTRLKNGGQKMPPFGYLSDAEVGALLSYLDVVAAVPGSGKVASVTEPPGRAGELLVKGTCHICHDATGSWPAPQEMMDGAIPPIEGFTSQKTLPDFIWKVRRGAPVVMGSLRLSWRGRMPVFNYLSDDEVTSAYLYLIHTPPR